MTPYHRAGHTSRWRALGELLLAAVFAFMLQLIQTFIWMGIWGIEKTRDPPADVHTFMLFAVLAVIGPAALLAARVSGRRAGTMWSVLGRVRWRWLATCLVVALCVRAISSVLVAIELVLGRKAFAGAETYAWQLALVLALVPLQALAEELFFRGTLLQAIGAFARTPWPAIIISATVFTLAHGLRPEMVVAMAPVGLALGWLAVRTGGLEASIAYHVALNVLAMAAQFAIAGGSEKGVNVDVTWGSAAFSGVSVVVYAIIVARRAKRLPAALDQAGQPAAAP